MSGHRVATRWASVIALALAAVASGTASADAYASGRVYAELGLGAGGVRIDDLDFYPAFATATLGGFILPGIGVEAFADAGLREGVDDDFQIETESALGLALRLESPPVDGLAGYLVLGYAGWSMRLDRDDDRGRTDDISEDFTGARVSIGLVQRFVRVPWMSLSGEFRKYYVEDGLDLDALVFALRFSAP